MFTVRIGSLSLHEVLCNASNYCTVKVNSSQLTGLNGFLNLSVVASNFFGSGENLFPMPGLVILMIAIEFKITIIKL